MALTKDDIQLIIDGIEAVVGPRFDAIDERFDRVESRLDGVERTQASHSEQLLALNQKLDNIDGKLQAIEAEVKELYMLHAKYNDFSALDKQLKKSTTNQKVIYLHRAITTLARENNITIPKL